MTQGPGVHAGALVLLSLMICREGVRQIESAKGASPSLHGVSKGLLPTSKCSLRVDTPSVPAQVRGVSGLPEGVRVSGWGA
jgi:hypothetical protein